MTSHPDPEPSPGPPSRPPPESAPPGPSRVDDPAPQRHGLRALADDKPFLAVFAVLAVAAIVPLWRVRFLPLLDQPNHLASVFIWHNFGDPAARLQEFYTLNISPVPYFAYYFLTHVVAYATGVETANKIVLSAYVLAIPAAALLFTVRTRRSPWLSVLTFPLAYTYSWSYGFQPFNIGLAALLLAVVALDAYLERPRAWLGVAVAILGVTCDLSHPLTLFGFYLCVPILLVCHRPRLGRLAVVAASLVPAFGLFVWQMLRPRAPIAAGAPDGPFIDGVYLSIAEMMEFLPRYTLDSVSGKFDTAVFWVMVGTAVLLFGAGLRRGGPSASASAPVGPRSFSARLLRHRSALLAVVMFVCYLAIPLHLTRPLDWWFVSGRFAPLFFFFAFLVPTFDVRGAWRLLLAPAVFAALALPLHISQKYVAFNERARPFTRLVARARPGANVLFLTMRPRGDEAVNVEAYNQFSSWEQVMRGGYSHNGWFGVEFPYKVKKHLPAPPWSQNERFDPAVHAGPYDYVIVRNERRPVFPAAQKEWQLIEREGPFTMYERVPKE